MILTNNPSGSVTGVDLLPAVHEESADTIMVWLAQAYFDVYK